MAVSNESTCYFISSLPFEVSEIARAIRGRWMVESCHWHLDVTFRQEDNRTLEKQAAFNFTEGIYYEVSYKEMV